MNSQRMLMSLGRFVINRSTASLQPQHNGIISNNGIKSMMMMNRSLNQQHVHSALCCCNNSSAGSIIGKRYFAGASPMEAMQQEDEEDAHLSRMMEDDQDDDQDNDMEMMDEDDEVEGEESSGMNKEYSQTELHDMIRETQISIYRELLDCPKPLDSEVKKTIYLRWKEDPQYYNTKKLSQMFQLHRSRIAAIIRFQQIYEKEVAEGNEVFDDLEQDIAELLGTRTKDTYLGVDEDISDDFYFIGGKENEFTAKRNEHKKRPDPLHEIPVQVPESFPEKPIYFRQPSSTQSKPKRKNLIFIDTSRDPFTNRPNPDPMMLISGIDGSLRTPSTSERKVITEYITNPKIRRDPEALLRRPLKYKPAYHNDKKSKATEEKEEEDD
ncbi:hypothetical protein PPL_03012 [Heterostelium album PN500]|uniref:Uncharacterized protein n=1 Tax=Heterostelium pallidum (strain ATCC 26659 / Pp 5 / PN500) TaxID=670386 RepID=D3B3P4_HETP5|nr:hypothetical protein PPL_03012 [Heterostelium album PN500]EFA83942.1 hypothetical protein PPL_03012 [Heterostelium album PN500]|eukprot:XP_020436059.1 hypothetical protein PPL_03012 [Heterostelium album PN500]